MDLDPRLAALRPLGGFFVLRAAADAATDPSRPLPTLADAYADTRSDVYGIPLTFRVELVARRLRAPEPRVSASIAQQGLAARLWSAALGCAALYGRVPDLDPRLLRWDPEAGAPDDLWLTEVRALPATAAVLADTVLHTHLGPLGEALRARYGIAAGLLWGNAGSALAGAARALERWARGSGRGDVAGRARALTADLFAHPLLSPTGTFAEAAFRRRSCCLYYRVPGGGLCGDCCFSRPPYSSPRAPSGPP
ncbi:(2Fe-2S)-binding protein [Streptomyces sp. NPDC001508]|uniref:(2Fe-2S)-binding protein n=1 Tax=Streptomyces sp. NPDC001508 TaxID=3154656 RepID=UPI0033329E5D